MNDDAAIRAAVLSASARSRAFSISVRGNAEEALDFVRAINDVCRAGYRVEIVPATKRGR